MLKPLLTAVPPNILVIKSRQDYKAKFGVEAPEWISDQPVKNWVDQTTNLEPDVEISYVGVVYDSNGHPFPDPAMPNGVKVSRFSLFPEVAQTLNLLPDPLPPQGALTPAQLRMAQRQRPLPIALKPGEHVVFDPMFHNEPLIDDGKGADANTSPVLAFEMQALDLLTRIAAKVEA